MIPQTPLCVADRNTYWVRKLFCKNELLAAMCLADRVLHLWHGVQNRAYVETSVLRARTAEKSHSLYWL